LGPRARVSKDQARSVRDERPSAPCLREPGIPRGTPLYGEALGMSRATNHQRVKYRRHRVRGMRGSEMIQVTLTETAANKVKELIQRSDPETGQTVGTMKDT